ncbi:trypsin-like peptidase domain-containing protein [Pseudomonas aeruginosa]|nr:trypsin-like peptidase domain-containing protein [Pseudomonas aeruginosa]
MKKLPATISPSFRQVMGVLALSTAGIASAAAAIEDSPERISENHDIIILDKNSRSIVSTFSFRKKGAISLKLEFEEVSLPRNAYIEIISDSGSSQIFNSADSLRNGVVIHGEGATIKAITNGLQPGSLRLTRVTYQPKPKPSIQPRRLIGNDNRRNLECYGGTQIYAHSLASAIVLGWGSGSVIGGGKYVLTNAHIAPEQEPDTPVDGEIRLGYFRDTCGSTENIAENKSIALRTGFLRTRGVPISPDDYALIELNQFDVENSKALSVFGSLEISDSEENRPNEEIYVPQYGNGGIMPMQVSVLGDDQSNVRIVSINNENFQLSHNADTQGASSGSPLISSDSNKIIGLHWGWQGNLNSAVGLPVLRQQITPLLGLGNNEGIQGEGKFRGYNVGYAIHQASNQQVKIPTGGNVVTYPDMQIEHHGDYSNVEIQFQDLANNTIVEGLVYRVSLHDSNGIHDLSTPAGESAQLYINPDFPWEAAPPQALLGWLPLKVNDNQGQRIRNLILSLKVFRYDPFQSPFDGVDTVQLNLDIPDSSRQASLSHEFAGGQYGYVAAYKLEGPDTITRTPTEPYSVISVPLQDANARVALVKLRGYRSTDCSRRAMNAGITCDGANRSSLILSYLPEDNPNLTSGTYSGILPLTAVANEGRQEALVNINLTKR